MDHIAHELSYFHRGGEAPLLGMSIDEAFRQTVAAYPEKEALVSLAQGERYTYQAFDRAIETLARGLLGLGVERGDRVGIWSPNNAEWAMLQMATARIGAILVNINPSYREEELAHALRQAKLQLLCLIPSFRHSHYLEMLRSLCPALDQSSPDALSCEGFDDLRRVVVYDPAAPMATERPCSGCTTWSELLAAGEGLPQDATTQRSASLDFDDPINIQFTSGTTGRPKAVLLTHHGLLNNAYAVGQEMKLSAEDRLCVPVPLYHCFGMVLGNLSSFAHGATVVLPGPHFEPKETLQALASESCTAVHGVPTMFVRMLEVYAQELNESNPITSLRTGIMAGAPCPPEIMRRVIEELGCHEILIAYGQTESSPVTHITHADDDIGLRVETVGTNLPHQEVKVIDPESGALVPFGQPGEVCFRGYHVMRGYYRQPDATATTIDDAGWLHSGDLGVLDPRGYLTITGRLKDMIIRGGENIYPAEIEALLYQHPDVLEVAVFGIPDETMGEEVGAWVQLHEGATTDEQTLRDYVNDHLAHFKVPKRIWFVDEFPMTVTGKIQKFRIRDIVAQEQKQSA